MMYPIERYRMSFIFKAKKLDPSAVLSNSRRDPATVLAEGGILLSNPNWNTLGNRGAECTIGKDSGKWSWEVTVVADVAFDNAAYVATVDSNNLNLNGLLMPGFTAPVGSYGYYAMGNQIGSVYLSLLDLDNHTFKVRKNNVEVYSTSILPGRTYFPQVWVYSETMRVNFGQAPFVNTVPGEYIAGVR